MDIPFLAPSRPETPQPPRAADAATHSGTSDAPEPSTSTSAAASGDVPARQTLDQEVASVLAGFGSFWGKVRKQSVNVLKDAEKQVEQYTASARPFVEKARENIDHFSENARAEITRLSQANANESGVIFGADGTPIVLDEVSPVPTVRDTKGKAKAADQSAAAADGADAATDSAEAETARDDTPTPAEATLAFLNNLQSQIAANPNVKELSKNLSTLQTSVSNNLSQLPHSFETNLEQLKTQFAHIDLSDSQKVAEAYLHKGEHWLQEFSQEVTKLAKDAVTIVPPADATSTTATSTREAALGRKDMLLASLRNSKSALLVDPAQPPAEGSTAADTRESFAQFLQSIEDSGGFEGESWLARIRDETNAVGDKGLSKTFAELVPHTLSAEAFWTRYFFRVSEIERDEANRRRVLESTSGQADEDFSWDADEEEEGASSSPAVARTTPPSSSSKPVSTDSTGTPKPATTGSSQTLPPTTASSSDNEWGQSDSEDKAASTTATGVAAQRHGQQGSSTTSPRASSDGTSSYDVVNAASGAPSEVAKSSAGDEEEDDSDWE